MYIQIFIAVLRVWMIFQVQVFSFLWLFTSLLTFIFVFSFFHNLSYSSGFSLSDKKGIFLNIFHFHFEKLIFDFLAWRCCRIIEDHISNSSFFSYARLDILVSAKNMTIHVILFSSIFLLGLSVSLRNCSWLLKAFGRNIYTSFNNIDCLLKRVEELAILLKKLDLSGRNSLHWIFF